MDDPDSGLNEQELLIMDMLVRAWALFVALNPSKDDLDDARFHIHAIQNIIAQRAIARWHPKYWR